MQLLKIILIDDEPLQLQFMENMIHSIGETLQFKAEVTCFSSGEAFLFALEEALSFDICFIDIQMKSIDGLEVAKNIRARKIDSVIVFTTAFAEYAIYGYEVKALDYLLKPVSQERLISLFQRVLQQNEQINPIKTLLIHYQGVLVKLDESEIEYIEAQLHQTRIVTRHTEYLVSDRFKQITSQLSATFLATHRSYMVNLAYIQQLSKQSVLLSSGKNIPLSRRLATNVQKAFIQYYKKDVFYGTTSH